MSVGIAELRGLIIYTFILGICCGTTGLIDFGVLVAKGGLEVV